MSYVLFNQEAQYMNATDTDIAIMTLLLLALPWHTSRNSGFQFQACSNTNGEVQEVILTLN